MARLTPIAVLALLTVGGCAEEPVVIDGSTSEAFAATTSEARRQIPEADRLVYDRAIRTVGGRRMAERDSAALARMTFDGMTASEVVADQRQRD